MPQPCRQPDGLLPDNVGLGGVVGEYMGGRWYGAMYGWSWPHGFYNIGACVRLGILSLQQRHVWGDVWLSAWLSVVQWCVRHIYI